MADEGAAAMDGAIAPDSRGSSTKRSAPDAGLRRVPCLWDALHQLLRPPEMLALACDVGFAAARHVSAAVLNHRYFASRADGLRTSSGEELLVTTN